MANRIKEKYLARKKYFDYSHAVSGDIFDIIWNGYDFQHKFI